MPAEPLFRSVQLHVVDIIHESLHIDQRRVTLVAVINLLLDAEFVQEQDAADANLLQESDFSTPVTHKDKDGKIIERGIVATELDETLAKIIAE